MRESGSFDNFEPLWAGAYTQSSTDLQRLAHLN